MRGFLSALVIDLLLIVGNDSDFICIPSKTDGPSLWLSRLAKKCRKISDLKIRLCHETLYEFF